MRTRALTLTLLLLLSSALWAAPKLVSPTVPAERGYHKVGEHVGPITIDGVTTVVRITNIEPDHKVAVQIFGTFGTAQVTAEMRICAVPPTGGIVCPFITGPNFTWPVTAQTIVDNFQVYGPETEIRLSIASAGGGTSLFFTVRQ